MSTLHPTQLDALKTRIDQRLGAVIDTPEALTLERDQLLAHFIGSGFNSTIDLEALLEDALTQRVESRLPLPYITGYTDFFGLRLHVAVSDAALKSTHYKAYIPRLETELLVERAIAYCKARPNSKVVDIATGSGCIAVSVKKYCPDCDMTAIDISDDALAVAQRNANSLDAPVRFLHGPWMSPVDPAEKFDLILCNPPYVPPQEAGLLSEETRRHEPDQALFPKETVAEMYRRIYDDMNAHLRPDGAYLFEIGFGQFQSAPFDVCGYAAELGFSADITQDQTGVDRFVFGQRR